MTFRNVVHSYGWMLLIPALLVGAAACKKSGNPANPAPKAASTATWTPTPADTPTATVGFTPPATCVPTPITSATGTGTLTLAGSLTGPAADPSVQRAVVLIHGWCTQPPSNPPTNGYSGFWLQLEQSLRRGLGPYGAQLMEYHWEQDASTGAPNVVACLSGNPSATLQAVNYASAAASQAYDNGDRLANQLAAYSPNLKDVTFIAHSAGAWAAFKAARTVLNVLPCARVQVVLLDPFIPGVCSATNSLLTTALMSTLAGEHSERIYKLENYYVVDTFTDKLFLPQCGSTAFTSQTFAWRPQDLNVRVDYKRTSSDYCYQPDPSLVSIDATIQQCMDWHSEPLRFYWETADSFSGNGTSDCLAGFPQGRAPVPISQAGFYNLAAFYGGD